MTAHEAFVGQNDVGRIVAPEDPDAVGPANVRAAATSEQIFSVIVPIAYLFPESFPASFPSFLPASF